MNSLSFDDMTLNHIFEKNKNGQRISRTLADYLSKEHLVEIHVRLNKYGKKEYYWLRHTNAPLSEESHLKHFATYKETLS